MPLIKRDFGSRVPIKPPSPRYPETGWTNNDRIPVFSETGYPSQPRLRLLEEAPFELQNLASQGGVFSLLFAPLLAAQTYSGPLPAKPDLPYLVHADSLIPTEATEARQSDTKEGVTYTIAGAGSSVKTPLASPAFLIKADKLPADKLQLYGLRSVGTHREITFLRKKKPPESYTFTIKPLGKDVYRLEVNESLPNGEYSITPGDSNQAFCFAVY